MATLEKARPPTMALYAARESSGSSPLQAKRNSLGRVPSSPSILRTPDAILLPSVPTHEPEDNLPSPHEYQHHFAAALSVLPSSDVARQGGLGLIVGVEPASLPLGSALDHVADRDALPEVEGDDTEEVEELRDDEDEDVSNMLTSGTGGDLNVRLQRLSALAFNALLSLERTPADAVSELISGEATCRRELDQALHQMRESTALADDVAPLQLPSARGAGAPVSDPCLDFSDFSAPSRTSLADRLATLQQQLGQLRPDPAIVDDLNLATALCALLISVDLVQLVTPASFKTDFRSADDPATQDAVEFVPGPRPGSAMSVHSAQRRGSFATARSSTSEELRDPFAETAEADIFDHLYRSLSALQVRGLHPDTPVAASPRRTSSVVPKISAQSPTPPASAPLSPHPSSASPQQRREPTNGGPFSPPEPQAAAPVTESCEGMLENAIVDVNPDLGAWKQLAELATITKELVAIRRSLNARQQDSPRVSNFGRSRSHSHNSFTSHPEVVARDGTADPSAKRISAGSFASGHATVARSSVSFPGTQRNSVWSEHSLPPAYAEGSSHSHDMQTKEKAGPGDPRISLPSYSSEGGLLAHFEAQDEKKYQQPAEGVQSPPRISREVKKEAPAAATPSWRLDYAARTPQDLLMVQNSIERLYTAVPQLLDQRCAMTPETVRDASLQRMMDRFAATPRLEDQRADPPLVRSKRGSAVAAAAPGSASTPVVSNRNLSVEPETRGRRFSGAAQLGSKFSVSNLANTLRRSSFADIKGKSKEKEGEDGKLGVGTKISKAASESLDDLLDIVDRVQDLGMSGQRTHMKPRAGRMPRGAQEAAPKTAYAIESAVVRDPDEALFELLNSQGQSRLAEQDAVIMLDPARRALRRASQPEPWRTANGAELGSLVPITASSATPRAGSASPATARLSQEQVDGGLSASARTKAARTLQVSSCESEPGAEQSGDQQASSLHEARTCADGVAARSPAGFRYVLETQPSLRAINAIVSIDPARSAASDELFYEITSTSFDPTDPITIGRTAATARLSHPSMSQPVSVSLFDLGLVAQTGKVPRSQDHFAFRLATSLQAGPAAKCQQHHASSEPAKFPLSFDSLSDDRPSTLCCSHCASVVADLSHTGRFRALPSQHWEELVDAWMCHGDQELNESVARGKQGLEEGRPIPKEEVWVADLHLLISAQLVPQNSLAWGAASSASDAAEARCTTCHSLLGTLFCSSDGKARTVKLLKHSLSLPSQPDLLPQLVAAQMLELSRAHAVHHFTLTEEGSGRERMLIWLFQPSFSLVTSAPIPSSLGPSDTTIHAVKCLFQYPASANAASQIDRQSTEEIQLPALCCDRLERALLASNGIYPPTRQSFGPWRVGWLPRLTSG